MRVVRSAGENVSPSDDGRLFAQIFDDVLFTDATFTALGTNNVQISPIYGDLCGRDFTIEQMTIQVELPEGEGTETGVIYIEIDTSSDDVITVNSALDPFTPTYEDINTNGAVAQMVIAEYTATSLGVSSVTAAYTKLVKAGNVLQNLATVESGNTASQNYAVGDYVCVNGILYKVTAAIASGQSFTVGTNIEQTNVGTELSSLNSNLSNAIKSVTETITTDPYNGVAPLSLLTATTIPIVVEVNGLIAYVGTQYAGIWHVALYAYGSGEPLKNTTATITTWYIDRTVLGI